MTDPVSVSVRIQRGTPSEEELAAVIAVVAEAYTQEVGSLTADERASASGWMQSRRQLRQPLQRERGWAGFRG